MGSDAGVADGEGGEAGVTTDGVVVSLRDETVLHSVLKVR